jgi:hypothetical protein
MITSMNESSTIRPSAIRQRVLAGAGRGAMVFEFRAGHAGPEGRRLRFALFDRSTRNWIQTLKMLAAGSPRIGIEPLVRVPRSEYHFMARSTSARSVMVPMVESVEVAALAGRRFRPGQARRAFGVRTTTRAAT